MSQESEFFSFAPEVEEVKKKAKLKPWKILIADDEKDVHTLSRIVLSSLKFDERNLEILEAYNGTEAKRLLLKNPDCALVLLDVVMDSDDEGLSIVKWIREVVKNQTIRIILRTGQPGDVPEKDLIINYDIDGFKEKTELTDQKLFTSVYTALRSYKDLKSLEDNKKQLEEIIHSSAKIFSSKTLPEFIYNSVYYLTPIISDTPYIDIDVIVLEVEMGSYNPIWGSGAFKPFELMSDTLTIKDWDTLEKSISCNTHIIETNRCAIPAKIPGGRSYVIYLKQKLDFNTPNSNLLEIYVRNIEVGLEKILLSREIEDTQKEIIYTLGDVVESRSLETGSHVRRVGEMSYRLAILAGCSEADSQLIKTASPMHDIGKISIPETILHKGDKLSSEDMEIVKTHTTKGYEILKGSKRRIIKTAAIIALQHHERWDGNGYPMGLKDDHIHLFARITTVVDVFDALLHDRVYKKAWPISDIIDFYKMEKGKIFDPDLTEIFLENINDFTLICNDIK